MSVASYILGVVSALFTLSVVIEMLRRRRLKERHAVWWFVAGTFALIISVFPATLEWFAEIAGVEVPVNLVFFASAAILFLVCLQHSAELTTLEEKVRVLTEESALLDLRLDSVERRESARRDGSANRSADRKPAPRSPEEPSAMA